MSDVTRKIAAHELDQCCHDLDSRTRHDLLDSLVRQWIDYDGNAVILTPSYHFWFRMKTFPDGRTQVVREREIQEFVNHMRKSRVSEEQIPELLHELSLRQNVRCVADYGQKLQLRVDPGKRTFFVELVLDDDELPD
jgi:hypothetical protein